MKNRKLILTLALFLLTAIPFAVYVCAGASEKKTELSEPVPAPKAWNEQRGIPVLCYHQIVRSDAEESDYAISLADFKVQLKYLKDNGYRSITLGQMEEFIKTGNTPNGHPPEKLVLITFDDGLRDFPELAAPALEQYGFRAVHYIYPTYLMARKKRAMQWSNIPAMEKRGHETGSHTYWHPLLNTLNEKEERNQFVLSQKKIAQNTGVTVHSLAYPFGVYTDRSPALLRESGYRTAFTIFPGENLPGADPYHLNRFLVPGTYSLSSFVANLKKRSLPVQNINPPPGTFIPFSQALSVVLPTGLSPEQMSLHVFSKRQNFSYDAATGKLTATIARSSKKMSIVRITVKTGEQSYTKEWLYNHRL